MTKNYRRTKIACYLGFITQAITVNFISLLFVKFHTDYSISVGKIALIPALFFFTQIFVDLFCAKYVDDIGYRKCIVASEVLSALGLICLAFLPDLLIDPYTGIIISVIIYALGSGLIEVLCSPIIEACPFENKEATMSLLHSFYCWGTVGTILISTLLFSVFGIDNWKYVAIFWAIIPTINIFNFATCPIESIVKDGKGMSVTELIRKPLFWVCVILMICSGASELAMSQWASFYVESSLGFAKNIGDIVGPCLFAFTMGICRVYFGKSEGKIDLTKFMAISAVICIICYILASFSKLPIMGLIGCIFCGFSVAIMWPGTLSLSSKKFPLGGTVMFALLATSGDIGGSLGPALVGKVTQAFGDNIRIGLASGMIFPCLLLIMVFVLKKKK